MATRFLDKITTATTTKIRNLLDAAGIAYDTADGFLKYNDAGTLRTVVNTDEAQTLTNKVITTPTGTVLTESVTATNAISASESGSVFFLNNATTEFDSTIPAPFAGGKYTFIIKAAPSGASYTITSAGANQIVGQVYTVDVDSGTNPDFETAGSNTITFVDSKAVVGDSVELVSDGTLWYAKAFCSVFDAITFTDV